MVETQQGSASSGRRSRRAAGLGSSGVQEVEEAMLPAAASRPSDDACAVALTPYCMKLHIVAKQAYISRGVAPRSGRQVL